MTEFGLRGKCQLAAAAARFLALLVVCAWIAPVSAQPVFGPAKITVTPPLPNSVNAFQITVGGPIIIGCSPIIVGGTDVTLSGSVIQVTILLTCGIFTTSSAYLSSVTVGPLPPGDYTNEHFRRIRGFITYGSPLPGGSLPLTVIAAPVAEPIPTLNEAALVGLSGAFGTRRSIA